MLQTLMYADALYRVQPAAYNRMLQTQ